MRPSATAEEIISKLNDINGNVKTPDRIVQDFYSACQGKKELCSAWGVRIETLFQLAVDRGEIEESRRNSKLKERFWRGLYSEKLRTATRVSYESSDSFEVLRRKARLEEEEDNIESTRDKKIDVKVYQQTEKDSVLQELLDRLKKLESELATVKSQRGNTGYQRETSFRGSRGRRYGHSYSERRPDESSTDKATEEKKSLNEKTLSSEGKAKATQ